MEKQEFNLSEKEKTLGYDKLDDKLRIYPKEDVKEFIRLLKEEIPYERDIIDKLAGDKLISQKEE